MSVMGLDYLLEGIAPDQEKRIVLTLMMITPPFLPLESLTSYQLYFLYRMYTGGKDDLGTRLGKMFMAYLLVGGIMGAVISVSSRFAPLWLKRIYAFPTLHLPSRLDLVSTVVPTFALRMFGIPFTLLSEIFIIPCAVVILFLVAQLKDFGDYFDDHLDHLKPVEKPHHDTLVILIHGNRFNECQWLFGRVLMHSRFGDRADFITVNYFVGPMKRDHTKETVRIEGCSAIVLEQIKYEIDRRGLKPKKVVLMGHSLGGVVSTHIAESEDHDLPITHVVSWSAPLAGSALLLWGKQVGLADPNDEGIRKEFCPTNEKLHKLQAKVESSVKTGRVSYFAVTGYCDPLVRPESALLTKCFDQTKVVELPHLGHYNIKVSSTAWRVVMNHLETIIE